MMKLLQQGDAVYQMMQVTGEEGITVEDFITWQKATLIDMVYLQQDAFDEVDASMPRERQLKSFNLLKGLIEKDYGFSDKEQVREFFTRLTSLYKNLNYAREDSPRYSGYEQEIQALVASVGATSA